jgi:hypothetical protein
MHIIAKTNNGYLIEASNDEVSAILTATGLKPDKPNELPTGTKIPAYDYAATIQKAKVFARSGSFQNFKDYSKRVSRDAESIIDQIEQLKFEE